MDTFKEFGLDLGCFHRGFGEAVVDDDFWLLLVGGVNAARRFVLRPGDGPGDGDRSFVAGFFKCGGTGERLLAFFFKPGDGDRTTVPVTLRFGVAEGETDL